MSSSSSGHPSGPFPPLAGPLSRYSPFSASPTPHKRSPEATAATDQPCSPPSLRYAYLHRSCHASPPPFRPPPVCSCQPAYEISCHPQTATSSPNTKQWLRFSWLALRVLSVSSISSKRLALQHGTSDRGKLSAFQCMYRHTTV